MVEQVEAVTADDMLRVARRYARPNLVRMALLGPFRSRLAFEKMMVR